MRIENGSDAEIEMLRFANNAIFKSVSLIASESWHCCDSEGTVEVKFINLIIMPRIIIWMTNELIK